MVYILLHCLAERRYTIYLYTYPIIHLQRKGLPVETHAVRLRGVRPIKRRASPRCKSNNKASCMVCVFPFGVLRRTPCVSTGCRSSIHPMADEFPPVRNKGITSAESQINVVNQATAPSTTDRLRLPG